MQGELFLKSQYGVARCLRCGSVGTIVDMGRCCRIAALQYSDAAKLGSGASLSRNDSDTTRNEGVKAA